MKSQAEQQNNRFLVNKQIGEMKKSVNIPNTSTLENGHNSLKEKFGLTKSIYNYKWVLKKS